ncbi:putative integrase/recombinase y4rA [Orchesella cincta]|uniref:Putative integrase/recombinase y4rA n=1 Tax=Orchesella cincta TaxID=48709 RepID=A0A1D2N077_ORCCI|nr:putative integrase/recombinase y4rA [Orchesella cincta]
MQSWAKSTIKQYDSALRNWHQHTVSHNVNLFEATAADVMTFLRQRFDSGSSYSAVNTARSAVALLLSPQNPAIISENQFVKRVMKACFRIRPQIPKYSQVWDVTVVLRYLEQQYPNEQLSLQQVSKKLCMLLCLATAARTQTLASINVNDIVQQPNGIKIRISKMLKTTRPGFHQSEFDIPYFEEKPSLCVGTLIMHYLNMTKDLRKSSQLFVSYQKPWNPVGSQTIARWIRTTLSEAGVDISNYGAHSVRHAASSTALKAGVSLENIRASAGWSKDSLTFQKFYKCPIEASFEFSKAVLSN